MTKTIEDYKKDYALAKAAGDAAGMQAANDGANALRAASGQAAQYATTDIQNTAKSSYTPVNATSAPGVNYDNYLSEVAKQQSYQAANPTAGQAYTADEKQTKYGSITDPIYNTGVYTKDKDAAYAAAAQQGVSVTPTQYFNGEDGYYYVGDNKDQRTVQEGASGADEGLMTNQDYAIIQSLKQQYADAQKNYQAAQASGDTALAAQYQQAMDSAHLEAERIRAGYGYSGGSDGSMYITGGALSGSGGSSGSGSGSASGYSGSSGGLSVPGGSSLTGYVNDYSAYLEQMYAAQKAAALAELKNAYEQNVNAIDRAGEGIGAAYQEARNQTAGASELAGRNFNEYAAANGLNSGTGGQAELARNVTLQNNLNTLNGEEAQAIADLELQRSNAETEYNNAIAQAEAEGNYQLAAALYQEKVRYDNAMISAIQQEYENAVTNYQLQYQAQRDSVSDSQWAQSFAFQQQQYADSLSQNQNSTLASYGETYLQMGIMPSDAMLTAMGITQADAQAYINALSAATASGTSSGSSSGSSVSSSGANVNTGSAVWDEVDNWVAKYGSDAAENYIKEHYKDLGYSSASAAQAGWANHLLEASYYGSGAAEQTQTSATGTGYPQDIFNTAVKNLTTTLNRGDNEYAAYSVGTFWNLLSSAQKAQVRELLDKYGLEYNE